MTKLLSNGRRRISLTGLSFALLLVAVCANLWFSSAPMPLGGPNALLAAAAAALALLALAARILRPPGGKRSAALSSIYNDFRPLIPALTAASLLALWALAVYIYTDTLNPTLMAKMLLGIGILLTVYLSVDNLHRARLLALAVVAATFVSALWGLAVAFIGDPFLTIWLNIASVREVDLYRIFTEGRVTGFLPYASTFGYQLAVAIPIAFAALLCGAFGRGPTARRFCDAALFLMLLTLAAVLVMNATRAAVLGLLITAAIIIAPAAAIPQFRRRLLCTTLLMSMLLLAFSSTGFVYNGAAPLFGAADGRAADAPNPSGAADGRAAAAAAISADDGRAAAASNPPATAGTAENVRGLFSYSDWAAQSRIHLATTALRYSLDHPLGAGAYRPDPTHVAGNLDPESLADVLKWQPHNQFLNLLTVFGYPGMLLLILFYALTARSLIQTAQHLRRRREPTLLFLLIATSGATAAYFAVSIFHPTGPFLDDWSHCIILALAFTLHRLAARPAAASEGAGR